MSRTPPFSEELRAILRTRPTTNLYAPWPNDAAALARCLRELRNANETIGALREALEAEYARGREAGVWAATNKGETP